MADAVGAEIATSLRSKARDSAARSRRFSLRPLSGMLGLARARDINEIDKCAGKDAGKETALDLELYLAFVVATAVMIFLPGPSVMLTVAHMYTHPAFVRRGVGRLILSLVKMPRGPRGSPVSSSWHDAGRATVSGRGYQAIERVVDARGGVEVPLLRMWKHL